MNRAMQLTTPFVKSLPVNAYYDYITFMKKPYEMDLTVRVSFPFPSFLLCKQGQ